MIDRKKYQQRLQKAIQRNPVVGLIGPRQCGKTTLARQLLPSSSPQYFDLEDPVLWQAFEHPMSVLSSLQGLVIIDEAQRRPDLFPVLRVLADRENNHAKFLILGSASPDLSRQASESLAGRLEIVELNGFDLSETGLSGKQDLWQRGGFPRSFLAASEEDSFAWRRQFIRSFLERDLAQLGFGMSPQSIGRFWMMLAHYHAQLWNGNEIAVSMNVSAHTTRSYLDALEQTFMVRRLQPWFVNVGKRLVKTPKIYFRDSGIFQALLNIQTHAELLTNPKLGASWEGFAIEEILRCLPDEDAYFYAVHSGSELDLYLPGRNIGIEVKYGDAPKVSRSMGISMRDLNLERLLVVYPGSRQYELAPNIQVCPLSPKIVEML